MGAGGVSVDAPLFDQDLRLFEGVEDLPVEQLVTKSTVEALVVAILPGAARLDGEGFRHHLFASATPP